MKMLAKLLLVSAMFASTAHAAYEAQCFGEAVRNQGFGGFVNSVLFVKVGKSDTVGIEAKLKLLGHVGVGLELEDVTKQRIDYYSVFNTENHLSSLAPEARRYRDKDYFRFAELRDSLDNGHDGGGMNGYLVISRKIKEVKYGESFDAHFIVQSGDHFGGTIDYTCTLDY